MLTFYKLNMAVLYNILVKFVVSFFFFFFKFQFLLSLLFLNYYYSQAYQVDV